MRKGRLQTALKNGGLFAGLLIITFYMVFRNGEMQNVPAAIRQADLRYGALGIMAMCLFIFCEGINLSRALRTLGCHTDFLKGLKYALTGFFFSSVTPSASGGQPMQLFYMHRDGIPAAKGTLALLLELLSFQTVTVGLALSGFFLQSELITRAAGGIRFLLLLGIGINAVGMILLFLAVFSRRTAGFLIDTMAAAAGLFLPDRAEKMRSRMKAHLAEYTAGASYIRKNPAVFLKTLGTSLIQLLAMYSVTFLVYRGLGLSEYTLAETAGLQAVLYSAVSVLPLPGALGISESGFMMLFRAVFPAGLLSTAMLLSRGITFYLSVLVSGCASACFAVKKKELP
ncbi:MAG: YbhN family protein [Emergencia sp.]